MRTCDIIIIIPHSQCLLSAPSSYNSSNNSSRSDSQLQLFSAVDRQPEWWELSYHTYRTPRQCTEGPREYPDPIILENHPARYASMMQKPRLPSETITPRKEACRLCHPAFNQYCIYRGQKNNIRKSVSILVSVKYYS